MPGQLLFVLLVAASFLLTGCAAPLVITAGAGAGYVATREKPRSAVEAFFDDLGRSIRQTTRRITGEPSGRRSAPSAPSRGFTLKIQRSTLAPTEVDKGEQVTLTLQYLVTGASGKKVTIREKSSLGKDGKELTVLKDESSEKENGKWENTLSFAVPKSARSGKYTVTLQISAQGQIRSTRRSFTVR